MGIELVIGEPGDSEVFVVGDPSSEIVVGEETTQVVEVHPTVPSPPGPQGQVGPKGDPGGWVAASNIANDVNLDTLTTAGMYFRGTAAGTTTALGYPLTGWAGWVEVLASGGTVMQRATTTHSGPGTNAWMGNTWFRTKYGGSWQAWARIDAIDLAARQLSGTGFPTMAAAVGTRYTDTAATNGAVEWIKSSGTGTSGWEVTYGDTGWRDISDSLNASWVKSTVAPSCRIKRVGSRVTFEARLNPAPSLVGNSRSGGNALLTIPLRFNPSSYIPQGNVLLNSRAFGVVSTIGSTTQLQINPDMTLSGNWTATDLLGVSATWEVNQAWPTTLPGTPV